MARSRELWQLAGILFCACLGGAAQILDAQTTTTTTSTSTTVPDPNDLSARYLRQDLDMSTIEELGDRLRALSLSDKGTRDELVQRLADHYGLTTSTTTSTTTTTIPGIPKPSKENSMVVTIESAGAAQYMSVDTGKDKKKEDVMHLSGGVSLTILDSNKGSKHVIRADEISYNKQREVMTARGNVRYQLTENGKDQYFSGEEMDFSLHDSEGRFLDGLMQKDQVINSPALTSNSTTTPGSTPAATGGSTSLTFKISGFEISRNSDSLVVMDKPNMTSSTFDIPNYHIEATKIWSLTPGEWAISDAALFVGRIPLFYFPFFYYPPDDLVFHPVVGFDTVEGVFIQTTTYILGRKPDSTANNNLSFMEFDSGLTADNSDLRPHGLFLQKVPKDKDAPPQNPGLVAGQFLKILADYYAQLGYMIGLQGDLHNSLFTTFNFNADIGFSRPIFYSDNTGSYSNYQVVGTTAQEYWDSGYFGGVRVPFRFRAELNLSAQVAGLTFNAAMPLSSDPFFKQNFLNNRKEEIDWAKVIGLNKDTLNNNNITTSGASPESADPIQFSLKGTLNTPVFGQWLQSIAITSLGANFSWNSAILSKSLGYDTTTLYQSANQYFYAPYSITVPDVSVTLSGSFAKYPAYSAPAAAPVSGQQPSKTVSGLIAPWEDKPNLAAVNNSPTTSTTVPSAVFDLKSPYKSPASSVDSIQNDITFNLPYQIIPSLNVTAQFAGSQATDISQVTLDTDYWLLTEGIDTTLSPVLGFPYGFGSISASVEYKTSQASFLSSPSSSLPSYQTDVVAQQQARNASLSVNAAQITVNPLVGTGAFDKSSLSYNIGFNIYQLQVTSSANSGTSTVAPVAVQTENWLSWNSSRFISHNVVATLAANLAPFSWSLSETYNLPPKARSLQSTTTLKLGQASLTAGETINFYDNDAPAGVGDLTATLTLPFADWINTSTVATIDLNDSRLSILTQSIGITALSSKLTASLTGKYFSNDAYSKTTGTWTPTNDFDFRIHDGSLTYDLNIVSDPFWKNRITTGINPGFSYTQDFIDVTTSSTLSWYLTWFVKVQEFLDLSFTVSGANTRMYKYFPVLNDKVPDSVGDNFFTDLGKSFNFSQADQYDRTHTNFIMQSIVITATHYLGDWKLDFSYTGKPLQVTTIQSNQTTIKTSWNSSFTVSVAWAPIPEITTTVSNQTGDLTVK